MGRFRFTVPREDLADHNPGHGTHTVREETAWVRQHYGTEVNTRDTASGVEFTVTGDDTNVDAVKKLFD